MKTAKLKVRKIGNSLGIILPKETVEALQVEEGTSLYMSQSPAGIVVSVVDDEFDRQMAILKEGMQRYRNALRELAK